MVLELSNRMAVPFVPLHKCDFFDNIARLLEVLCSISPQECRQDIEALVDKSKIVIAEPWRSYIYEL